MILELDVDNIVKSRFFKNEKYELKKWKIIFNVTSDETADFNINFDIIFWKTIYSISNLFDLGISFINIDSFDENTCFNEIKIYINEYLDKYKKYKLNLEDLYIERLSFFLWRWNINSKIWFIWNEEAIWYNNTLNKKIEYDWLKDKKINYITDFFWEDNLSNNCTQYTIINNILKNKLTCKDFFISEIYFLPTNNGSELYNDYWWNKAKMKNGYYSRDSYYVLNKLDKLLNRRLKQIFNKINKSNWNVIIIYWLSVEKVQRIEKLLNKTFVILNWKNNIKYINYNWNTFYLTPFFDNNLTQTDISELSNILSWYWFI